MMVAFAMAAMATSTSVSAAESHVERVVHLDSAAAHYTLGGRVEILEDPAKNLLLSDVLEPSREGWVRSTQEIPNFGLSSSAFWLRLSVKNQEAVSRDWLLEVGYHYLDAVDFAEVSENETIVHEPAGDLTPFTHRAFLHHNYIFPFSIEPGETRTLVVRVESSSTVQIPLNLYTADALRLSERSERLGIGIFYGILLMAIFYNLFIYILTRDTSHLLYLFYVFFLGAASLSAHGIFSEFVTRHSPYWTNQSLLLSLGLMCLFCNLFTYSFLQMRERSPRFARVSEIVSLILLGLVIGSFFLSYRHVVFGLVTISVGLIGLWMSAGIYIARRGYHPARYYLAAWGTLMVGIVLLLLKTVGLIESNFFTTHSIQLASSVEIVLLSIALADRLRILEVEKEAAQAQEELSRHVMNRYLPPTLVDDILDGVISINQQAHSRDITVLFSDLAGFTKTCESVEPEVITTVLNDYLSLMNVVIFDHGGTVDKFIGDAIMVIFGAPQTMSKEEQLEKSTQCGLAMQHELEMRREEWVDRGLPVLQMRIGIHHGPAIVGNFGSEQRSDYTCIGHTVNVASRIESACEPGRVFVSDVVASGLEVKPERVGMFTLKGVQQEQALFVMPVEKPTDERIQPSE